MSEERAAVRGVIDGCLSILGVVIGAYGVEPSWLLSAALAGNLANSMSNLLAAFSAESVQHFARLRAIERAMLTNLRGTEPDLAARTAAVRGGVADGLATLGGGCVPILPFLLFRGLTALSLAIAISLLVMLVLGAWAGRASYAGMWASAVKLALLGLLTVLASLGIHYLVAPGIPIP